MVAQRLGDFTRPEIPEEEWFEEDDEGRLRINLLRAPTIPAVVAAQTDGWVPDPPPQTRSVGTQTTTVSIKDEAIQAFPTYGTTEYWLDQRDGNPGGPQQRDRDMEPRARLALHPHELDCLGLDSGGLQRFDFPNDSTPRRELKHCHFHDRMMTHNSDGCPFPHFSCMQGLGCAASPRTTCGMAAGVSWMAQSKKSRGSTSRWKYWTLVSPGRPSHDIKLTKMAGGTAF
jgi:hypothetical protein